MEIVDRAILVIDSRVDALVGLRDRIPPERAVLRRAQPMPQAIAAELRVLRPHPFAVAGVTRDGAAPALPAELLTLLEAQPIPVVWWGEPPAGLPAHARPAGRWAELRDTVLGWLATAAGGVSLADHRGLLWRGAVIHSPALEGMVAGNPAGFSPGRGAVRSVRSAIARHRLPLRLARPGPGLVALEVAAR